jgi:hypothetical protein
MLATAPTTLQLEAAGAKLLMVHAIFRLCLSG